MTPPKTATVKNPAATLSPVVTTLVASTSPAELGILLPAEGLPVLVPPVLFVTGMTACDVFSLGIVIIADWIAPRALICCPTPVVPSYVAPAVHLKPHTEPEAPPSHCDAAATADFSSNGVMVPEVKGARTIVWASQAEK